MIPVDRASPLTEISPHSYFFCKQDACYTGITRDAGADSFIPTVCFAD